MPTSISWFTSPWYALYICQPYFNNKHFHFLYCALLCCVTAWNGGTCGRRCYWSRQPHTCIHRPSIPSIYIMYVCIYIPIYQSPDPALITRRSTQSIRTMSNNLGSWSSVCCSHDTTIQTHHIHCSWSTCQRDSTSPHLAEINVVNASQKLAGGHRKPPVRNTSVRSQSRSPSQSRRIIRCQAKIYKDGFC